MNVLYTCDNNYLWIMGISAISLFENTKHIKNLTVYLLGENISDVNKSVLQNIADQYDRKIVVIDVPELDIPDILVSARWPLSAFTRLFSGQLLPTGMNRILYLDCDTIIMDDIEPLDSMNIKDNIFYGIKDCIGSIYKQNIGIDGNAPYINAGVLLINLDELRNVDIKNMIDQYMKRYVKLINYADQDILNGVFSQKIGILDPKYDVMTIAVVHSYKEIISLRKPTNYYTEEEIKAAISEPVIVHYTTNMKVVRPWFKNTDHPFAGEFRKYMAMSPWNEKILQSMYFNSKESKIIGLIQLLPSKIAYKVLGMIHSQVKPMVIRYKACKLSSADKLK